MSEPQNNSKVATPWHLWMVGVFALLWSGMGALDYVMTQTRNESYMSNFSPEQLAFFYGIPVWAVATWAMAVWGGVLGAVLLLMRLGIARWVFLVSVICMVATSIENYVLSNGLEIMGDAASLGFTALIFLFAVAFYIYSMLMKKRGVLA